MVEPEADSSERVGTGDPRCVNYPDVDRDDGQSPYDQGGYPARKRAEAGWDPADLFNHRQSIELPPGPS